jgi:hypothetical protein
MINKVQQLAHGLLAIGLMGCGTSSEVAAHPPAAFASEPVAVAASEEPPVHQVPGRPLASATARQPAVRLATPPAGARPEAAPALAMSAVNRRIQAGRIIDEAGQPLVGATVLLKGTTRGTSTDANGDYALPVPLGLNTFVVAYTGYQEEVAQSRDGQPLTVTLLPVPGFAPAEPAAPTPKNKAHLPAKQRRKLKD